MANLKLFHLFLFFALIFTACSPVEYKFSKNYTDKLNIVQPFFLFDFRSTDLDNPNLKSAISEVLFQRKCKFDSISMTPLTYKTEKEVLNEISLHNPDYVFVISPLENFLGRNKGGVFLSSQNYLIEIKKGNESNVIKKCIMSIPAFNQPSNVIQQEQIRHGLNQFLDY